MKNKPLLFRCSKRGFGVFSSNYCDWFEKKKSTLIKRSCKNCRFFTNEEDKQESKKKITRRPRKETKRETKEQKE